MTYSYDLAGRRKNANNQLATWGTANLFYDANGNMTSDGTHGYTWDARDRLAATRSSFMVAL